MWIILVAVFVILVIAASRPKNGGTYVDSKDAIKNLLFMSRPRELVARAPHAPRESVAPRESAGEISCRSAVSSIFNRPFVKARPGFLQNVTGQNLELDCYNENLGLAVEYNGKQHYEYVPYFHKNKEAFLNTKQRDFIKQKLCKEAGIKLIVVPYTVKPENIRAYIEQQLD